ncbi:hypothetical protein [Streptomyces sp. A5-4]|uniref:hypothetical protein n=1 Tax=Streptomyces sp. A5-4 TaxID=3384771 RepID=UPI003DA888C7
MSTTTHAMPELEIEDQAAYYQLRVVQEPGKPESIREEVLSGFQVRAAIRRDLLTGLNKVEQNGPTEITMRRTGESCTYSKVC